MAEAGFELRWKGRRPGQHSPSWPAGLRLVPCRCDCAGAGPGGTGPGGASAPSPPLCGRTPFPPHSLCLLPKATVRLRRRCLASPPPCSARARCGCGVWRCGAPLGAQAPQATRKGECSPPAGGEEGSPQEPAGVLLGLPTTTRENCQFLWPQALPGQQWAVCGCLSVGTCLLCSNRGTPLPPIYSHLDDGCYHCFVFND